MQIAPKAGRLATGSYSEDSPLSGNVFRRSKDHRLTPATVGGLKMKDDRQETIYGSAQSTQFNISTQVDVDPVILAYDQLHSPTGVVPDIQPHERGSTLKQKIVPVEKRQFGGGTDNEADTAFHRNKPKTLPRPQPVSAKAGERTLAQSFFSWSNLWNDPNNSFYKGAPSIATDALGIGRWDTVKKGAV